MDPDQKIIYTYTKGKGWVAGYENDELLTAFVFYNPAGYADAAQGWMATLRVWHREFRHQEMVRRPDEVQGHVRLR